MLHSNGPAIRPLAHVHGGLRPAYRGRPYRPQAEHVAHIAGPTGLGGRALAGGTHAGHSHHSRGQHGDGPHNGTPVNEVL
jgi:hypothetical protein